MRQATKNVVATTAALGAASLAALYLYQPVLSTAEINAALAFAVFSVFGALMPYTTSERTVGQATVVTFLASVALSPTWMSVAAATTIVFMSQLFARVEPIKVVFNVSQHALALSAAVCAYLMTAVGGAVYGGEIKPLSVLAAFAAFSITNTAAIASVLSAETDRSFVSLWKDTYRGFLFDLVAIPFVFVFVAVYVKFGVLPTSAAAALILIVRQLHSTNEELHTSNKELLELTVTTLEARDPYTSGHSRRVSQYSRMMGQQLMLSAKQIDRLAVAALLHDVGKIHEVFAPILSKPGKLTAEERAIMESHPIKGAELVRISSHLRDTVEPIRHHHEAWDGSGYPDALAAEAIPVFARIIAIADTIDAMASDRPYRRGLSAERIRAEVVRMSGIQFDPKIVSTLIAAGTIDTVLRLACSSHEHEFAHEHTLSQIANA